MSESVFIVDFRWKIQSSSLSAQQLFGLSINELKDCFLYSLIPELSNIKPDELLHELSTFALIKNNTKINILCSVTFLPDLEYYVVNILSDRKSNQSRREFQRLKAQFDKSPISIYIWQKTGNDFTLLEYNLEAQKISHGVIENYIGSKASSMFQHEAEFLSYFDKCHQLQKSLVWEGDLSLNFSESTCYVAATFEFVEPDLLIIYLEDKNKYKSMEEVFLNGNIKWRSIIENSPDNIMLLDKEFRLLYINHTSPGVSKESILGIPVYNLAPIEQREEIKSCYQRVFNNGIAERFESDYSNGQNCIHYESWVAPVYLNAHIFALTVYSRNITEQKQLSKHVSLLLESTSDGIFGVDTKMKCTFVNKAAMDMLGYRSEEILGMDMYQILNCTRDNGILVSRRECPIFMTLSTDKSYWSDSEIMWCKDGGHIPVQFSSNPISENGVLTGAVVIFRDVSESRAMAKKMDYLATHDILTGLINRYEFERRLEKCIEGPISPDESHILCYLDLDQFKVVNDTCGHVAGDELLRQLGALLQKQVRGEDTFARLGGDEFGVLLQFCDIQNGLIIIEKLLRTVTDYRFIWKDKSFAIGVSIGVVQVDSNTLSLGEAMISADSACYMAKDSGRNRVHVYQADDKELAIRASEMQWVMQIQQALESNSFALYYQLIKLNCDLSNSTIESQEIQSHIHAEILIRMHSNEGRLISPELFIPAAERYNLMPAIDRWVIRETFLWIKQFEKQISHVTLFSINLSGHSICDEKFMNYVFEQIKKHEINPDRICFEVTETAVVANLSRAISFIDKLKNIGCKFALDDFGSGMSSFTYLKNLPVDFLKIDGNFVRDIVDDPIDRAMVEAINQVGQVMGIKTIGEFVENEDILDILHSIGVDYSQGLAIGKPRPLKDLLEY